jgi:hypothetical protein
MRDLPALLPSTWRPVQILRAAYIPAPARARARLPRRLSKCLRVGNLVIQRSNMGHAATVVAA